MTDRHPGASSTSAAGSSLRDSLLKAKIAKLPHLPAVAPHQRTSLSSQGAVTGAEEEEENEDDEDGLGALPSASSKPGKDRSRAPRRSMKDSFSPLSAEDCFESALEVDVGQGEKAAIFRVYYTPPRIPSTAGKAKQRRKEAAISDGDDLASLKPPEISSDEEAEEKGGLASDSAKASKSPKIGTVFLLHHGAGYSALSYALVAKHITKITKGAAGVLAFDCRGHGRTVHASPNETNALSLDNLTNDALLLLAKLFPDPQAQPNLILVGHSMGGSVVVSLAHAIATLGRGVDASEGARTVAKPKVAGVAVLDVVEGTAMAALPIMKNIVSALPKGFDSVEDAIRWHVDSGTIVNVESARRSVPSLLKKNDAYSASTSEEGKREGEEEEDGMEIIKSSSSDSENATQEEENKRPPAYVWRHNLLATEPYWTSWFASMSSRFLSAPCARLLLLAGTDRLDKDLMIGQMQGKYQLEVFVDVGHSLQEDAPERTADLLVQFWQRNEMVLPAVKPMGGRGGGGMAAMTKVPLRKVGQQ